jgi:hypothetical protein
MLTIIACIVIGFVAVSLISFLFAMALDGEVLPGVVMASIIPIVLGIYHVGYFIANEAGWL